MTWPRPAVSSLDNAKPAGGQFCVLTGGWALVERVDVEPVLPFWMRDAAAAMLVGAAVGSIVIYYLGDVPDMPIFREQAALDLLFVSVLPLLLFHLARLAYTDPPPEDMPGGVLGALYVVIGIPMTTIYGLTGVFCLINGIVVGASLIGGQPAQGDWA